MGLFVFFVFQIDLRFESIDNQPFEIDLGLAGIYVAKVCVFLKHLSSIITTVELQWLEHLWNHENMFETGMVRDK